MSPYVVPTVLDGFFCILGKTYLSCNRVGLGVGVLSEQAVLDLSGCVLGFMGLMLDPLKREYSWKSNTWSVEIWCDLQVVHTVLQQALYSNVWYILLNSFYMN